MVGTSVLKGILMIGSWKRFKASSAQLTLGVSDPISKISFVGKRQSLVSTLLSLVLICWKVGDDIWCLLRCCGILLFPQKRCFLLGKFGGAKFRL